MRTIRLASPPHTCTLYRSPLPLRPLQPLLTPRGHEVTERRRTSATAGRPHCVVVDGRRCRQKVMNDGDGTRLSEGFPPSIGHRGTRLACPRGRQDIPPPPPQCLHLLFHVQYPFFSQTVPCCKLHFVDNHCEVCKVRFAGSRLALMSQDETFLVKYRHVACKIASCG